MLGFIDDIVTVLPVVALDGTSNNPFTGVVFVIGYELAEVCENVTRTVTAAAGIVNVRELPDPVTGTVAPETVCVTPTALIE